MSSLTLWIIILSPFILGAVAMYLVFYFIARTVGNRIGKEFVNIIKEI